jgi:hypothetical protein
LNSMAEGLDAHWLMTWLSTVKDKCTSLWPSQVL